MPRRERAGLLGVQKGNINIPNREQARRSGVPKREEWGNPWHSKKGTRGILQGSPGNTCSCFFQVRTHWFMSFSFLRLVVQLGATAWLRQEPSTVYDRPMCLEWKRPCFLAYFFCPYEPFAFFFKGMTGELVDV